LYAGLAVKFDENGVPVEFSGSTPMNPMRPNPIYEALKRFNSKFYFIELIRQWTYFTRLAGIVKTTDPENTNFCKSVDRLRRETDRDHIPFMVVATPLMPRGIENIWPGIKFDPQELEKMMACVKKKGIETVDLSGVPVRESWYTRDQLHSSPEGAEVIAKSVEAAIKNFFHRFNLLKKPLLPAAHRP